jgi:hypothetical protein
MAAGPSHYKYDTPVLHHVMATLQEHILEVSEAKCPINMGVQMPQFATQTLYLPFIFSIRETSSTMVLQLFSLLTNPHKTYKRLSLIQHDQKVMQSILKYLMVPIQYNSNALINTVSQK